MALLLRTAGLASCLHAVAVEALRRGTNAANASVAGSSGCCGNWASDGDKCGTCYYHLSPSWCTESADNCAACGSVWCTSRIESCTSFGCGTNEGGRPCQCDSSCLERGDCCSDYDARCTSSDAGKYWESADLDSKLGLKSQLASTHKSLSYGDLWNAYKTLWVGLPGKCQKSMYDVYSNKCWKVGTDQCGQYRAEGDCYNREHSWPKSWWGRATNSAYTDVFHVVPSDGYVNGKRSSLPFGEVNNPSFVSAEGNKVGPCSSAGFKGTCFEPADDNKGSLARGNLYMSVRYAGDFSCCDREGVSGAEIKPWMLRVLLQWHKQFPAELWEQTFNDRAQNFQGNRNPFIDFPNLADSLF